MDESTSTKQSLKIFRRGAVLAVWLVLPGSAWAQQAPGDAKTDTPTEEAPRPAAEPPPAAPPIISAGPDGFTLASADKQYQLALRGYIQVDGRIITRGKDTPGSNTFLVRRARPIFEGTLFGLVDFRLMPDFGSGTTVLQDASLDVHPLRELQLQVGKFKVPVGLERIQSDQHLLFLERGLTINLVPNRDVGFQFHGELLGGMLTYSAGAFNSVPDGGLADSNFDDNVDLVGRLFAHPFRRTGWRPLQGLGLGFAGSRGNQHGSQASTGVAPYRSAGQQNFFSYFTSTTTPADTVVADGQHVRLAPQGYYFFGPLGLLAEYVSSSQEVRRGTERARVDNTGWQVAVSYVLFGGNAAFEGVRPSHVLTPAEGHWGAVELATHYSELHIDPEAFPRFADPNRSAREARGLGAVVNWYWSYNTRVGLQVERTTFEGGGANGGNRPAEFLVLARFQVGW